MMQSKDHTDFSGIFGETLVLRKVNGFALVKVRRKRNMDNPTPNQIAFKAKFREASAWARKQTENPQSFAFYESKITKKRQSAYSLALKDYCKPPTVKAITRDSNAVNDRVGGLIQIEATDLFMIVNVSVVITDRSGYVIEKGEAMERKLTVNLWDYRLTVDYPSTIGFKVTATAFDRAGHTGTLEVVL